MVGRLDSDGGGFSVLDGVALVTGAAVASVHVRGSVLEWDSLGNWVLASCLFGWLSLTSAGPFVFLVRRFFTRPAGYPRMGDKLWAFSGVPWVLAALLKTGETSSEIIAGRLDPAYVGCLGIGLTLVAVVSVAVVMNRYLLKDPGLAASPQPGSWTDRIGLFEAVAWPVHCGVGLVVLA